MGISLDNLEKVELTGTTASSVKKGDTVTAIFKVKKANYVPDGVKPRARINAKIFTGSFKSDEVGKIESDENVESISLSQTLRMIK
ncbi:MAG: hypothetical protein WA584_11570 [Pyrinomonadaceae bacterium]